MYKIIMSPNLYQKLAMKTAKEMPIDDMLINGALGLCGESGEVADHIKKYKCQDHPMDKQSIAEELGDVAWYLAYTSHVLGYTLDEILRMNIEKLKKRFPNGFSSERSVNRIDE